MIRDIKIPAGNRCREDLPRLAWLWLPIGFLAVQGIAGAIDEQIYRRWFCGEWGLVENLTVVTLLAGIVWGCRVLRRPVVCEQPRRRLFIVLIIAGCVYFAGEELSWGQHLAGWQTPEFWQRVNDQQETNLHNTSALFDQWPRTLLTLAALAAMMMPLVSRIGGDKLESFSDLRWYTPTAVCWPVCLAAIGITFPEKLGLPTLARVNPGELKELYLAGFLAVYLGSLERRSRAVETSGAGDLPQITPVRRAA